MSDIDISHGGAIAVDTEVLRETSWRIRTMTDELARVERDLRCVPGVLDGTRLELGGLAEQTAALHDLVAELDNDATGTLFLADAYEIAEIRARAALLASSDPDEAQALLRDADRLATRNPAAGVGAEHLIRAWRDSASAGFIDQTRWATLLGTAGPQTAGMVAASLVSMIRGLGKGAIPAGTRLAPAEHRVTIRPMRVKGPSGPPAGLEDALERIPSEGDAQVRVETYRMPDGATRYLLYAGGTRLGLDGTEPWDMTSNTELYLDRTESASYRATIDALHAAGAGPGDRIDVVGYSQGAAIATHVALAGEFEVGTVVTFGNPVAAEFPDDTMSVAVRHTDDLVSTLAGGDLGAGTGSPDSMVIEGVGDPGQGLQDVLLAAHMRDAYGDTAAKADASGDPRIDALRERFAELDEAVDMVATEYVARRE
ncbi:hypothetical protein GCM10025768_03080 [Microbacterium pseudoresistens]|uniref:Alpha/beta hydrolase n=1 Tax=Microbacterium pseudoresistens TaxID=640634 RepID=A0A7Y9JNY1_9MICO|nr:hypothetical protein [Microbacterium pseudoresistens]NYD54144.1 hypothetical protein [Microbacterium pseudoresistens]